MKLLLSLLTLSDAVPRYPEDNQLSNLDEKLIEIDIAGHGYPEKAIKKCGLRYMGPNFYTNWNVNHLNEDGTCNDPQVEFAKENSSKNPMYWILNGIPILANVIGGNRMYNPWESATDFSVPGFKQCADEIIQHRGISLPYCFMHMGRTLYDVRGYGDRYLAEASHRCFESFLYHLGPERMHGIFYDTSSTRSVLGPEIHGDDPNYAPEKEQEDLEEAANVVEWTRNFWRDNVLDEPVTVIANTGDSGSSGLLMKAKLDSIALKEHFIESYPNFMTGTCPDADPKYENDLRCVNHSLEAYNKGIRKWREELINLIKYGPLDPQSQFVMGWNFPSTNQSMIDQFGEDMVTRFTRFALESHVGVVTYSHLGNGASERVDHGSDFYADVFSRPEYQQCTGTWGEWGQWSNCDRSCYDGIRIRERSCSEGDAGLCDGSERDMQTCNLEPCYQWPEKGWTHWGEWTSCSVSCGGGKRDRIRVCKDDDNDCGGSDYENGDCNSESCPTNKCPLELKINVPDSWHTEALFPYENYYHRTEDNNTQQRPRYAKYAKDIELLYENDAWIVRDNDNNRIMLISFTDALCPEFIAAEDWYYLDIPSNEYRNDQQISFENAKNGDDYAQGSTAYSATTIPTWETWSEWSNCDGTCGADAVRTRTRQCQNSKRCPGAKVENESCGLADCTAEEKKLPCIADENGLHWRPLYRQYRSNGGIPKELEMDIRWNTGTYNANPPKDGQDYINFIGYEDNMKVDNKYHLKLVWSKGESVTWKQEEKVHSGIVRVQTTSDVVGQNHKGHSELVFHGLSFTGQLRFNSLFDGLADMSQEKHKAYYHEVMDTCWQGTNNWPGYNVVVFNDGRQWDQPQFFGTWLSKTENETPPQDNGDPLLGEGEALQGDNLNCMDLMSYWEYNERGNNNNYISLYIEDPGCPVPTQSFPTFVRCYGPQANPSEDGSSCDCGENATHDPSTGMCGCNEGYVQTKYVYFRMPLCVKCNGPGATPGYYGCDCGIDMDYNAEDGTCSCRDGLVMNSQGTRCYNGIDLNFDSEYNCNDSTEQIFATLTDDLSFAWGTKGTESVNCDKFGETVVEISMQTGVIGANAGTEASMIPSSLSNQDQREATLVFEVYLGDDMVMPWTMSFPGFLIQGPTWYNFQPYAKGGNMLFKGKPDACSFCDSITSYATIEPGQWYKVEQRLKLNDPNQANGEYIILWNDVEVVRESGLAEMVPNDGDYYISAYKLWTTIDWPAAENESKIYYRQITGKKFESNGAPHVTTTPATTTYPITTTPSKSKI